MDDLHTVISEHAKRSSRGKSSSIENSATTPLNDGAKDKDGADLFVELVAAIGENQVDVVTRILESQHDMILVGDAMGDTALHLAARVGHCDVILELIRIARLIHGQGNRAMVEQNADGDTTLHLAVKNGHLQAANHLIDASEPVLYSRRFNNAAFVVNKDGKSPNDLAKLYGYVDLVSSIRSCLKSDCTGYGGSFTDIEMKLSITSLEDEEEEDEYTTNWLNLCWAIRQSKEREVMQILGEKPSLIQHVDSEDGTVLHVAAIAWEVGIIRRLVEYIMTNNPNPSNEVARLMSERAYTGRNPLHIAVDHRMMSTAFYLTEMAPQAVYQLNNKGVSPLILAVHKGFQDLVSFMIDQAQESHIKQSLVSHVVKASLAHVAIKTRNIGILQVLLEKLPCLIDSPDHKGWKPLSYAASKGHLDQFSFLLRTFPDSISKCDRDGSMPIHKAIAGGHIDIVKEIIAQCPQALCDIDRKGRTTLHIATVYRKADILSYLLEANDVGMILNFKDDEGKTFQDMMAELKIKILVNCKSN